MPKGKWEPPEAGDAPQEVKDILKKVYSDYRDEHPAENPETKAKGAQIAWAAVKNAGWHKNKDGKWVKEKKESVEKGSTMKQFKMVTVKDFPIFEAGDYPQGKFTDADVEAIVDSYDPDKLTAGAVVGHSSDYDTKVPNMGIIKGLQKIGKQIWTKGVELADSLLEAIKNKTIKYPSIELYQPDDPSNPVKGKYYLANIGFLGAKNPQVKGLPLLAKALGYSMNDLVGSSIQFSDAKKDFLAIDFAEELDMEKISMMANEDTYASIELEFAQCLAKMQEYMNGEDDHESKKSKMGLALSDCYSAIQGIMDTHFKFMDKSESMLQKAKAMLSEKVKQFLTPNKSKESEMDAKKEQEYQEKISALDNQVKEFAEKERIAAETKTKAEKEAADAAVKAAEEVLTTEIKVFCDTAVKENRMTPAMREKDEPIMSQLGKTSKDALKSFQEKYVAGVVPTGVTDLGTGAAKVQEGRLEKAKKYVEAHGKDKEFAGLTFQESISRAVFLEVKGDIKFS